MAYIKAGRFVAAHGLKGELILKHEFGKKTQLEGVNAFFIQDKAGAFIPWFIASVKIKSEEELYITLEDIDNREAAIKLTQKDTWLDEAVFKKIASKSAPASLLGYVIVEDNKELGEILEVIEQPHQLLCRLEIGKKEVLIPLHEASLKKIDHKKKQVLVELPEGLLEIYLG